MQSSRTGVGAGYARATSEGPSRAYRGQSGFLGSSTRQGHYGFFGDRSGSGPRPSFFDPFAGGPQPDYNTPKFNPFPNRDAQFGRRGLTSPGPFVRKQLQKSASRILFDAAKFGIGKIALSEFRTALDIAQIMAQLYSGFIASNKPPELEMQFPITEFYDCPSIVYPQDYMPPFGRGPMSAALEWPLGQGIPPSLKCQVLQAFPAPGNDPPVVQRTFTWPIQPYLVLYGPIHPTLDRWSYDRLWIIETPGNTPVGTPLALYKPPAPYFIPYADPFPEPAYSPFLPGTQNPLRPGSFPPPLPFKLIPQKLLDPNSEEGYGGSQTRDPNAQPSPKPLFRDPPFIPPTVFNPSPNAPGPALPNITPPTGGPYHPVRPPGTHEKEKKKRLGMHPFQRVVTGIYGKYTEGKDATNAVYDALPQRIKMADWRNNGYKPLSVTQKLKSLYDNAKSIDMAKAAYNLAANEIQDRVIGAFSKRARQITKNPYWRRPVGPQSGDRFRQTPYLKTSPVI